MGAPDGTGYPPIPFWRTGLACRCPRCGKGAVFAGLLTVRDTCAVCGLDLRQHDSGDGPAVLVFFLLATIIVALVFWVEFSFAPPLWVHAVLWPTITIPLAIALMRPFKAAMVALQFQHRASEMGL